MNKREFNLTNNISETFTLSEQDNARLQSLCGTFDEHLHLIEKHLILISSGEILLLRFNHSNKIRDLIIIS